MHPSQQNHLAGKAVQRLVLVDDLGFTASSHTSAALFPSNCILSASAPIVYPNPRRDLKCDCYFPRDRPLQHGKRCRMPAFQLNLTSAVRYSSYLWVYVGHYGLGWEGVAKVEE